MNIKTNDVPKIAKHMCGGSIFPLAVVLMVVYSSFFQMSDIAMQIRFESALFQSE
jgi:hypothetical protein